MEQERANFPDLVLLAAPAYSRPFTEVVDRCITEGDKLRILPLAMELRLFGYCGDEQDSGRLVGRVRPTLDLTGLVIAFARQSLGLPENFVRGPLHFVPKSSVNPISFKATGDREATQVSIHMDAHQTNPTTPAQALTRSESPANTPSTSTESAPEGTPAPEK